MIRRAIVAPLASWLRRLGRVLSGGPIWVAVTELTLYLVGWAAWVLDWFPRLPAIGIGILGKLPPAAIEVRPVLLLGPNQDSAPGLDLAPGLERAGRLCADASSLLEPHGIALWWNVPIAVTWTGELPLCSWRGLFSGFFRWASARSDAQCLTVYLVGDFGELAGCSFPGADWIVIDTGTDGSTIVHELGHLADLWRHSNDPHNVMTDLPGGRHDQLTRFQAVLIRTSRFTAGSGPRPFRTSSGSDPG